VLVDIAAARKHEGEAVTDEPAKQPGWLPMGC
jgi:hypothetical protein